MIDWVHPGLILILGSIPICFIKGDLRKLYVLLLPVAAFIAVLYLPHGANGVLHYWGQDLVLMRVDRMSLVFGYIFCIAAFIGMVYGLSIATGLELVAACVYVGSSLGVVFAGDLITVFVFGEGMAASVLLVWAGKRKTSGGAGYRYILVHIFSGLCVLGGTVIYYAKTGTIAFDAIQNNGLAFYMILIGFLTSAAVPPFNAWVADAYPESSIMGGVFMCAFTTKTAVYMLMRGFAGAEILVWLGVVMCVYGIFYATLENDIRRLLSHHILSQVGYMVAGIGMGTALSVNGAAAHAIANVLYKGLLFMVMGAVIQMTGRRKCSELGGLYRTMPVTFIFYMIGAFSISAFPLFTGFVSKSMVISGGEELGRSTVVLLLTLASSGTFLSLGLKLPYYVFFGKDSGVEGKEPPVTMFIGMVLASILCIVIGVFPNSTLYRVLPFVPVNYAPYTPQHVVTSLGLLLFTALAFFTLLYKLHPEPAISLDTDWFYRKGALVFMWIARRPIASVDNFVGEIYQRQVLQPVNKAGHLSLRFDLGVIDRIVNFSAWFTRFAAWLSHRFDIYVVDGLVNSLATLVEYNSGMWRRLQTGYLQNYALIFILGVIVLIGRILLG